MITDVILRIAQLYPDRMSLNGDSGNLTVLTNRLRWRGLAFETTDVSVGDPLNSEGLDLILFGGGEDWIIQAAIAEDLKQTKERSLREAAIRNTVILATGGGYQLCGQYMETLEGKKIRGAGLLDLWTREGIKTMNGRVIVECRWLTPDLLVGMERHSGQSYLGRNATPLGRRVLGSGNNGEDPAEGCRNRHVFGSNLSGPVLACNPHFADHLLQLAIQRHIPDYTLPRLNDTAEWALHQQVLGLAGRNSE